MTTEAPKPERWSLYRETGLTEMRPYVPGEDLSSVSVSSQDKVGDGGLVARNPKNHDDKWYVAATYFTANYDADPVQSALD